MNQSNIHNQIKQAVQYLHEGKTIAYPTEAVYGLGCNPFDEKAVANLFHVKQRPIEKGVILVAGSVEQIMDWVSLYDTPWQESVLDSWPGPVTWVLPLKKSMPDWITGGRDTVAIRVSSHPIIQELCNQFGGPIVSTSANLTNQPPAKSCEQINQIFKNTVWCISAELGNLKHPTQIKDAKTGQVLRA